MNYGLSARKAADKDKQNSMTTNNILPPLPGNLTMQPQTASLSAKADAWRKAFEQEQGGILKDTRSVKFGEPRPTSMAGAGNTPAHTGHLPNNAPLAQRDQLTSRSSEKTASGSAGFGPVAAGLIRGSGQPDRLSTHAVVSLQLAQQTPLHRYARMPHHTETTSLIALFESHYRQKWPFKNVHVAHTGDGVSVWVRDSTLVGDTMQAQSLAQRIQETVQADGQQLVSLVLNGKKIIG